MKKNNLLGKIIGIAFCLLMLYSCAQESLEEAPATPTPTQPAVMFPFLPETPKPTPPFPSVFSSPNTSTTPAPTKTPAPSPTPINPRPITMDTVVFVNQYGALYHVSGCSLIGDERTTMKASEASEQGYKPCKLCIDRSSVPNATPTPAPVIVYVTNTGTKYHREGCQYLSYSCIEMELDTAIAYGYTPCSVCSPP